MEIFHVFLFSFLVIGQILYSQPYT
jgi:hypothetical protein